MNKLTKIELKEILDNAWLNKEEDYNHSITDYEKIEYNEEYDTYYYVYNDYIAELDKEATEYYFEKYNKHTLNLITMELE